MARRLKQDVDVNNVDLHQSLGFYLDAFLELSTCRPPAMSSPCPIPWTAIKAYAETFRMTLEEYADLLYFVRGLDDVWIKHAAAKQPKNNTKS